MGALSLAAFLGAKAANIKTLVAAGADPNERDPNAQDTPMMWAALGAPTPADRVTTITGYKAFLPPAPWLDQPASAFSGPADIFQALVDAGADAKAVNKANQTALLVAVMGTAKGYPETLQKLVALGVPVDGRAVDNTTALCLATQGRKLDAMKALMAAGADKNAICGKGNLGATPLMYASDHGTLDAVQVLVDGGADVNFVRKLIVTEMSEPDVSGAFSVVTKLKSWTALDLAVEQKKDDVVAYLKGKGAKSGK
jgi:ankyrin repeat protein